MQIFRIFLACIAWWSLLNVWPALADDLSILGANVQPNVVIILDTSSSMTDSVPSVFYDPNTTYSGPYTTTLVYKQEGSAYFLFRSTISDVPHGGARNALTARGYWFGRIGGTWAKLILGNHLNYQQCPSCAATGSAPKFSIAKQTVTNLINNVEGVNLGVMGYRSHGASMITPVGTDKTTAINAVNNAPTTSIGTPLGDALYDAGQYFEGLYGAYSSPIQQECQANFAILVTDGLPNLDSRDPVSAVANTLNTTDHASGLPGVQNVSVYTVGFSVPEGAALLTQTAANGGGAFYAAGNSAELDFSLLDTIRYIVAGDFSLTAPVLPSTSVTGDSKAYLASFESNPSQPFWRGFLQAYQRDANGQIPVDGDGVPLGTALVWDAGQELSLKAASSRTIFTVVSGTQEVFAKSNGVVSSTLLDVPGSSERDQLIDFIRGIDAFDENNNANFTEERAWKLGDILHSTPVLVSPPALPLADASYAAFKQAHASRAGILLAGANDGMLHAFSQSDGAELWAFIPPNLLSKLKYLTVSGAQHPFYMDASPIAADIKIGGTWKTIALVGERRGGKAYYALDITDTTSPQFLWSFTDARLGETWSEAAIGQIKLSGNTIKFVAFIGGGYDTNENNNSGKAFFVIDLETGQKLWEYFQDGSLDDRQFMNFSLAANPAAADLDDDGFTDLVYISDVGGQLWKFDVSTEATLSGGLVTNWTGKRLFVADPSQPNPPVAGEYYPAQSIYNAPALTFDSNGYLWVFFGTGDRNHPNNTSSNRFYGIKDDTDMSNGSALTEANLGADQGWFIPLSADEKVLVAADVFNNIVFFSTFAPATTASCQANGGTARLYAVQMSTGYAAINFATGELLTSANDATPRAKTIGTGLAAKPLVTLKEQGHTATPSVITATSDRQLDSTPTPPVSTRRMISWRDVY